MYGDLTVGAVLPIDPESVTNDVNVEGSVITSKLVLRDAGATDVRTFLFLTFISVKRDFHGAVRMLHPNV